MYLILNLSKNCEAVITAIATPMTFYLSRHFFTQSSSQFLFVQIILLHYVLYMFQKKLEEEILNRRFVCNNMTKVCFK